MVSKIIIWLVVEDNGKALVPYDHDLTRQTRRCRRQPSQASLHDTNQAHSQTSWKSLKSTIACLLLGNDAPKMGTTSYSPGIDVDKHVIW